MAHDLAMVQAKAGNDVTIIWTGGSGDLAFPNGVECARNVSVTDSILSKVRKIRQIFTDLEPDVVHLHMAPPWVAPFLPYNSAIVVVHLHMAPRRSSSLKSMISLTIQSYALRRADVLIPVSRWVEKQWRSIYPTANYALVYNGIPEVDYEVLQPVMKRGGAAKIGFATRLAGDKGIYEFARFAGELHKICPQAEFLVAGEGPMRYVLEELMAELMKCSHITFLGFVKDMKEFWSQVDISVFCAEKEPFGLRLIEPVSHGVPVVAYRTGAGSDEIIDVCSAIAAVPYGRPRELAALAASILSNDERRAEIVRKGIQEVRQRFSLEAMSEQVEQAYVAALSRRRNAAR